jgi:hypothetical protein
MPFYTNMMEGDRYLHVLHFLHFTDNRNETDMTDYGQHETYLKF